MVHLRAMEIAIARRFCGPAESGNGGYTCGRLAAFVAAPAEVTLRVPPPLDTPLAVVMDGAKARLLHGTTLVAEAAPAIVDVTPPRPPTWDEAVAASARYDGHRAHDFPRCFVCGPAREPGDALRLWTGPLGRDGIVAAPWVPHASLADEGGRVRPEFLWASVDCPGFWAPDPRPATPLLLGRFAARFDGGVRAGEECIAIGWPMGVDGRKHFSGTALFRRGGGLVGVARATWIALKIA